MQIFRSLLLSAVLIGAFSQPTFAQNKDGDFLLTNNGASNPEYSSYKEAPLLKTEGSYYPTPPFAPRLRQLGEEGTLGKPIPFATGILSNGDFTTDSNRRPMPYTYWVNEHKTSLNFDLGGEYHISKVRVCILKNGRAHGARKIGIYTGEELLEAGQQPMREIAAQNGWNEFTVNKPTDQLKLEFTRDENARFITVTEVEVWGRKLENSQPRPRPGQSPVLGEKQLGFDFGPEDSPLFPGFKPVGVKTLYTTERGYGWLAYTDGKRRAQGNSGVKAAPGLMERDRGVGERGGRWVSTTPRDDLYREFVGVSRPYTRDITQEFLVDLPNGKYLVNLTSGDLSYGHTGRQSMVVEAEGKRRVDSLVFDKNFRAHTSFNAEVKDGQLNLLFTDDQPSFQQGWTLSSLIISPANNATEIAAATGAWANVSKIVQAQQDATPRPQPTFFDYKETTPLFPLSAPQTAGGYLLFVRDWMRMTYPNTVPLQREVENARVEVAAAPTQYASATVGIYPLKGAFKATVEVSDLLGAQQKIDKSNLEVRVVGYMPERIKEQPQTAGDYTYYVSDSSQGRTVMSHVPKILQPYDGAIEVNETKQLWLTFQVPANTRPGQYRGTITVRANGLPQQTVPVTLTVYPFELLQSDRIQGVYWLIDDYQHQEAELANMAKHGIRAVTLSGQVPLEFRREGNSVAVDFSRLDPLIEKVKAAGLTASIPFSTASSRVILNDFLRANPDIKILSGDAYKLAIAQLAEHSRKNNWPEVLFYPVDEIGGGQGSRDALKYLSGLIREAVPDAKIYTTVNNFAAGLECMDYFDYATVNIPLTREQEQVFLDKGKTYMRYGNGYNFNPRTSRTLSGYGLWQRPAAAMYYYHYRYIVGDPMNPLDGTARDFVLTYPSPNGPVDSIDFEAIREGNNDLRYIRTLQVWMEKARKAGKATAAVKEGQAVLDEIMSSNPAYNQYDLAGVPNEKYHEWRSRMAQVIIRLQQELGPS